jgi:6-pyruvoyl-tetrahydropterin synthase
MIEISQEFGFDAAHYLGNGAAENRRLHGHSFYAEVTLRGDADPNTGFLRDFGQVNAPCRRCVKLWTTGCSTKSKVWARQPWRTG